MNGYSDVHQNKPSVDVVPPGKQLQKLRKKKKLSLGDIHSITRIPMVKLELLDDDNYSEFEAEVFVTGYIRGYAKAVGGDPDALIAAFKQISGENDETEIVEVEAPDVSLPLVAGLRGFVSIAQRHYIISGLIVVAVVLLVVMFSYSGGEAEASPIEPEHSTTADAEVNLDLRGGDASDNSELDGGDDSMPSGSSSVEEQIVIPLESSAVSSEEKTSSDEAVGESALSSSDSVSADIGEGDQGQVEAPEMQAPSVVTSEANFDLQEQIGSEDVTQNRSSETESEIFMLFTDECWVDIKDKNGKAVFADLVNKGDNLRLFGQAPFEVMLGNAGAVTLSIDGVVMDTNVAGDQRTLRRKIAAP